MLFFFLELNNEVGTVYRAIPDFLGIVKDANSQFLFNISTSSLIWNLTTWGVVGENLQRKCGYYLNANEVFDSLVTDALPDSSKSAGPLVKKYME